METSYSLQLHCYDNVCHCDWRLTLYGCIESNAVRIINISNIAVSAIISLIGVGFLYDRLIRKGHSIIDNSPKPGLFRPHPINSLALFLTLFSIFRMASSAILVADAAPNNMIFRSFFYEFGWECGSWACLVYIIGIAQATVESQKSISKKWLPSPHVLDIIGFSFLLGPLFTNNAASLTAGILATSNWKVADLCTQLIYVFWFVYCGGLAVSVIYFGFRLIQTLNAHLSKFNVTSQRSSEIKTGIFKIKCIIVLISMIQFGFAIFLLLYGVLRDIIMRNYAWSITLCAFLNLSVSIAVLLGTAAYLCTPTFKRVTLNGYETGQSTTVFETKNGTKVNSAMDMTFQDTLSNRALDNLEFKHNASLDKWNTEEPLEPTVNKYNHQGYTDDPSEMYIDNQEYEHFELQYNNSKTHLLNKTY